MSFYAGFCLPSERAHMNPYHPSDAHYKNSGMRQRDLEKWQNHLSEAQGLLFEDKRYRSKNYTAALYRNMPGIYLLVKLLKGLL